MTELTIKPDKGEINKNRITSIDSLRAIASLLVLFHHLRFFPDNLPFNVGTFGVLIFFIISGYCIVLSLRSLKKFPIREFAIRRFFRLYPAYWVSIVISLLLLNSYQVFTVPQVLANITMFQTALGFPDVNGNFWTLFYEILFYCMVGALLVFGVSKAKSFFPPLFILFLIAPVAIFLVFNTYLGISLPLHSFNYISLFLLGGLICLINENVFRSTIFERTLFHWKITLFSLLTYSVIFYVIQSIYGNYLVEYLLFASAIIVFVIVLEQKFAFPKVIVFIGQLSFSIYLVHKPILHFFRHCGWFDNFNLGAEPMIVVLTLISTFLVSYLIYRYVELPMIQVGKQLSMPKKQTVQFSDTVI